jgi:hypothetical protein
MTKRTDQQDAILEEMRAIRCMRRGALTEQYNKKEGADGTIRKWGPYYTLQIWRDGKNHSLRIPAKDADKVREEIRSYEEFSELCERYIRLGEQEAMKKSDHSKKKPRRLHGQSAEKRTNS